jgi:putative colanic acid biosynthesis acetyltransferase WcaF
MTPSSSRSRMRVVRLSTANKVARLAWRLVWILLYRPSPRFLHGWRRFLLRLFGARMGRGTYAYPSVQVWAPWNLEMREGSCLSHFVDCYCVEKVVIGRHATVSQYSFLCTASHDYDRRALPIVAAPIVVEEYAWITAGAFVAPGVTIGRGAVVAARSTVTRDVAPWTVVAGSPAKPVGERDRREFEDAASDGSPVGADDDPSV